LTDCIKAAVFNWNYCTVLFHNVLNSYLMSSCVSCLDDKDENDCQNSLCRNTFTEDMSKIIWFFYVEHWIQCNHEWVSCILASVRIMKVMKFSLFTTQISNMARISLLQPQKKRSSDCWRHVYTIYCSLSVSCLMWPAI